MEPQAFPLGAEKEVFKPSSSNTIAGFIFAVLLIGGGIVLFLFLGFEAWRAGANLPVFSGERLSWALVGFSSLLGVFSLIGGIGFFQVARLLRSLRVVLCEDGLLFCTGTFRDPISWSGIDTIQETVLHEPPPDLKVKGRRYLVRRTDGKEFGFDGNSVKEIERFGAVLREESARHGLAWVTVEEQAD